MLSMTADHFKSSENIKPRCLCVKIFSNDNLEKLSSSDFPQEKPICFGWIDLKQTNPQTTFLIFEIIVKHTFYSNWILICIFN